MTLYEDIAGTIRQQILAGELRPGQELPSVREMAERWGCAPGTIQRAYRELTQQGLITARVGQGTRVAPHTEGHTPLRRATLVNQIETFMLGVLATGYTATEIDAATQEVLDRWRARLAVPEREPMQVIRFVGSHDPTVSLIERRFTDLAPHHQMKVAFVGSLGGLIALARHGADIAGCHLWDRETGQYNAPHVRRLLPGRRIALLTLAHRRIGLIAAPGNPLAVAGLADLAQNGLRFVNRQAGAGSRIWLDAQLDEQGIDPAAIAGYSTTLVGTHLEVAGAIAGNRADVGLGAEAAALAYGLSFTCLTTERYDLAIPVEVWNLPAIQALAVWLSGEEARRAIEGIGGYDTRQTGAMEWVG